jgi:serine/threonine-protein kinase
MTTVATFEYYETLGEGVAGIVYRAKDPKGREVAVKLLRESAARDAELLRRFKREVDLATELEHPNLVAAYEGGQTAAGRLYLSSEFVRGANAARLLEHNRPLAEAAALSLARDVFRALEFLRKRNLVHRDVKPENILVGEDGAAKLSDFGLARSAAPGGARLTATGEVLGTPYYLAPEQIQAKKDVDGRADLYSVGCMLHEWLAGARPYDGATVVEILAGHLRQPIPDLAALRPGVRPDVAALVRELMEKDRERRLADPAAAARRCEEALAALGAGDGREAVRAALARVPRASTR